MTTTVQQFDYDLDLTTAILWQYDQSINLVSLIDQKQAWYDINQSQFWSDWFDNVFNLISCNTFGLTIWSIILNIPLYVALSPPSDTKPNWGFNAFNPTFPTLENSYLNFGNANFYPDQVLTLTEEEQRFLLRLKYFQLTTRGDIIDINKFLNFLCQTSSIEYSGTIYALDDFGMEMTYVFTLPTFSSSLLQAIKDLDVFPRPAGVGIKYEIYTEEVWGFGIHNQNFGHGNFVNPEFI